MKLSHSLNINFSGRAIAKNTVFNFVDYCTLQISRGGFVFYLNSFCNIKCIKNSAVRRKGDVTLFVDSSKFKNLL